MSHQRLLIGSTAYDLPVGVDLAALKQRLVAAIQEGAAFVTLPVRSWRGATVGITALVSSGLPVLIEEVVTDADPVGDEVHAGAAGGPEPVVPMDDWLDSL